MENIMALYFMILGHCQDAVTGAPPRGLQFTLGTKTRPDMFDTIVMANLVRKFAIPLSYPQ